MLGSHALVLLGIPLSRVVKRVREQRDQPLTSCCAATSTARARTTTSRRKGTSGCTRCRCTPAPRARAGRWRNSGCGRWGRGHGRAPARHPRRRPQPGHAAAGRRRGRPAGDSRRARPRRSAGFWRPDLEPTRAADGRHGAPAGDAHGAQPVEPAALWSELERGGVAVLLRHAPDRPWHRPIPPASGWGIAPPSATCPPKAGSRPQRIGRRAGGPRRADRPGPLQPVVPLPRNGAPRFFRRERSSRIRR